MSQIIVEGLSKTFFVSERAPGFLGAIKGLVSRKVKEVHALKEVSFHLNKGELVGYIGPNGAGKSTTIKVLSGILVPTSGRCEVEGRIPWNDRIAHVSRIGVVFGQRTQLWWDLPAEDSFSLLKDIYRVPSLPFRQRLEEMTELLDIGPFLTTPVRQLSLGQRMRCEIAAAMLHSPEILFLDEPSIGLDAVSKLAVRDFIRKLNREHGVTIILTSHDMDDIEALCERVIVIGNGTVLCDGSLQALRTQVSSHRYLKIDLESEVSEVVIPETSSIIKNGREVIVTFDPTRVAAASLISQISSRYPIRDLFVEDPPIEHIIAQLYHQKGGTLA